MGDEYGASIVASKITHFTKSDDGEVTFMHMDNGMIVPSTDSMNTLEARYNSCIREQESAT